VLPLRAAPTLSYTGSFSVWAGLLVVGEKKASGDGLKSPPGCIKPSEGALMLDGLKESSTKLARVVGTYRQLLDAWSKGDRHPADQYQAAMEAELGIPAVAWTLWRSTAPEVEQAPEPPPSKPETKRREPDPPTDAGGASTEDSSLVLTDGLIRDLQSTALMPEDVAQRRLLLAAINTKAKLTGAMMGASKAKLHDHPDWAGVIDNLVTALGPVPGALDALDAFLTKYAEDNKQ
jgi:hypothetical protein